MPSVVIRPKTLADLAEIWVYIAEDSPRQADAFATAICGEDVYGGENAEIISPSNLT